VTHRRAAFAVVLAAAVPIVVFLLAERRIAGAPGFPLDDSWIHAHFARNLAEGAGFSYNPGVPVAGSTAPLWTLLLAAAFVVFGASLTTAKALGVATTVAAASVTRRAALAWGASPVVACGAGIALLWAGPFGWGALSGMEVSLAALVVAGALWAHASDRLWLTALLAASAGLARPEALILIPLFAIARPLSWRRVGVFVVVTAAVLAPAVAFSVVTVGAAVPATARAKIEGGLLGWLAGIHEPLGRLVLWRPWRFVREWAGWLATTHWLLPPLLAGALGLAAPRRALGIVSSGLLLHPLAMATLAPYRGPAFQEGRYSMHLLPLALVVLAVAASKLPPRAQRALVAAYLGVALVQLPGAAGRYGWAVQNINAMQVTIGSWIDSHAPRRARVAVNDIGAIAWISRREIIDLIGLVTPEIIPYRRQGEDAVARYIERTCPDYVVVFPTWFPMLTARRDRLEEVYRVRLERNVVAGGPEMVVYRLARCAV
jgi:arabinofuranosyltransferase